MLCPENANVDQKARILEARVVENADIMEQLRQERSLLASDHKDLQKKFADVTEVSVVNFPNFVHN